MSQPKALSRSAAASFLAGVDSSTPRGLRNACALWLMYGCGLRVSEVSNLTMDDVNLTEGYVYVLKSKRGVSGTIPIDTLTAEWCARWLALRATLGLQSDWLLPTLGGQTRTGGKTCTEVWRKLCKSLSRQTGTFLMERDGDSVIRRTVHPHTLRHCFGTEASEVMDIEEVQVLMRHKSIQTTMVYAEVRPERRKAAMAQRWKKPAYEE